MYRTKNAIHTELPRCAVQSSELKVGAKFQAHRRHHQTIVIAMPLKYRSWTINFIDTVEWAQTIWKNKLEMDRKSEQSTFHLALNGCGGKSLPYILQIKHNLFDKWSTWIGHQKRFSHVGICSAKEQHHQTVMLGNNSMVDWIHRENQTDRAMVRLWSNGSVDVVQLIYLEICSLFQKMYSSYELRLCYYTHLKCALSTFRGWNENN